jgi:hypothetical protein
MDAIDSAQKYDELFRNAALANAMMRHGSEEDPHRPVGTTTRCKAVCKLPIKHRKAICKGVQAMKVLFRPFNFSNPEEIFKDVIYALGITAIIFVVIVLLIAGWAMWHPPKVARTNYAPYYSAKEYKRLQAKHGQRKVIIEEPGQVPYYIDAQGRKCKLM